MRYLTRLAALVAAVASCGMAAAQDVVPWQEYSESVKGGRAVAVVGDDAFGQKVDLSTGSLQFASTDVSIPGNNALPVQVSRILTIEDQRGQQNLGGFGDWDIDVPHIEGTFAASVGWAVQPSSSATRYNRCSLQYQPLTGNANFQAEDIWHGYRVHLPGGQTEELMKAAPGVSPMPSNGQTYPWITKSFGRVRCLSTVQRGYPGEGFELLTADGTKYKFDWPVERNASTVSMPQLGNGGKVPRKQIFLLATRVEDRFGNWVSFTYTGDQLTSINSSDSRPVTLNYSGDKVSSVVSAAGTWSYTYNAAGKLSQVTLPDNSKWTYASSGSLNPDYVPDILTAASNYAECTEPAFGLGNFQYTVTHPAGAQATFSTSLKRHYRTGVNYLCTREIAPHSIVTFGSGQTMDGFERAIYNQLITMGFSHRDALYQATGYQNEDQDGALVDVVDVPAYDRLRTPNYFDVYSLVTQSVTGPGLAPVTTQYAYDTPSVLGFCYPGDPCTIGNEDNPLGRWVTVTRSDGNVSRHYFGTVYAVNEGELLQSTTGTAGSTLREDLFGYTTTADIGTPGFPFASDSGIPFRDELGIARNRPRKSSTVVQQGVTLTSATTAFDTWARPKTVVDTNSLGLPRTSSIEYHDNLGLWVLGQQSKLTTAGEVQSETSFNAKAQPTVFKSFGLTTRTIAYNAPGTIATVKDGANNTTTLGSWYRGVPRSITYPDATTQAAVVSASGLITAITDQLGSKTCIAYDAMGRVSRINYPSETTPGTCDTTGVDWTATTQTFVPVATAEFGLPSGHWRQTVQTGNSVKVTYFDGRWRPKLVREYDAANVAATDRYQTWDYATNGQVAFASYPSSTSAPNKGVWTQYDALGRPTSVTQDSELGPLVTLSEYLNPLRTRITSPKGTITTTSHLAWGDPSEQLPIAIAHPGGAFTDITHNIFGNPTSLKRRNSDNSVSVTRSYVYDAQQRLCKTVEPETGATIQAYDAAGNIAWSKSGATLLSTASCNTADVPLSERTSRAYDALNRVTGLVFPDNLGNTSFLYTPDGLVREILADNGGTGLVTSAYAYNKRRLLAGETTVVDGHSWSVGYGYNAIGHLAAHVTPLGNIEYAPNALGQATKAGTYATAASYFANGALKQFTFGNGLVHTLTQNERGMTDRSRDAFGTTAVYDESLDYDAHGNVMAITDGLPLGRGNRDMSYDALDRLTGTTSPMFGTAVYGYDVLDNLKSVQVTAGTRARNHTYLYDINNRLTTVKNTVGGSDAITLLYDAQGNVRNKNGQLYTFDHGNRLRDAVGLEQYRYDGHGRRVRATHPTQGNIYSVYGQDGVLRYQRDERAGKAYGHVYLAGRQVARLEDVIGLPAPVVTAPASSANGAFTVSWTSVAMATRYELQQRTDGGAWTTIQDAAATSKAMSGLAAGTYGYQARACTANGCGAYSAVSSTVVSLVPSTAPTLTVPATNTTGSFTVSWTAVATATRYELQQRKDGGAWSTIHDAAATSTTVSGLTDGTYGYQARACNAAGCGPFSANYTTGVTLPPTGTPTVTAPASNSTGAFAVSWTSVAGATRYELQQRWNSGAWVTVHDALATSRAVSGLAAGSYTFQARACVASSCGGYSPIVTTVVTLPPTTAPTLTVPATNATGSHTVTWTAVATATRYELQQRKDGGAWSTILDAAANATTVSGLTNGTYGYQARACNAAGCGPYSAINTTGVTLPPTPAPSVNTPASNTTGAFTVSWTGVATATRYELQQRKDGGAWSTVHDAADTSKAVSGLASGTYGFQGRACNVAGCGPFSGIASTVVTLTAPPPPAPASLDVVGIAENWYYAGWTASAGATSYELRMNGGATFYTGPATSTEFSSYALVTYSVRACNAGGCSAWSAPVTPIPYDPGPLSPEPEGPITYQDPAVQKADRRMEGNV